MLQLQPLLLHLRHHQQRRGPCGTEARKQRAEAEAEAAAMAECTFAPRINSSHKSRQQRVAELLSQ